MELCKEKAYAFTNENLCSYEELYGFDGKRILTTVGSGDQYLTSIFYGAKDVELYDININAWYYFVLKFYSILVLSYEEFYQLYIVNRLNNPKLLGKVFPYLPKDVSEYLKQFLLLPGGLSNLVMYSYISDNSKNFTSDRIVPYFDKDKYYKLQNMLRDRSLPKFYHKDLVQLPNELSNKSYDLLLTSNIYCFISLGFEEYKKLLDDFNVPLIQAYYFWSWYFSDSESTRLSELGFIFDEVQGVEEPCIFPKNYVLTLEK